jgi:hypothetical protein
MTDETNTTNETEIAFNIRDDAVIDAVLLTFQTKDCKNISKIIVDGKGVK